MIDVRQPGGGVPRCQIPGYPGPVPDIRLPRPGAGYPAAGPVIRIPVRIPGFPGPVPATRLPGRPKKTQKIEKKKKNYPPRCIDSRIMLSRKIELFDHLVLSNRV